MTVREDAEVIRLEGICRVEEAEPLTALLQAKVRPVDFSQCRQAHSAILQVVLAFAAPVAGHPAAPLLRALLQSVSGRTSAAVSPQVEGAA